MIEVTGYDWFDGGCEEPESRGCGTSKPPPARPIQNVKLSLDPALGGPAIPLGTADADSEGSFSMKIKLPRVANGKYVLIGGQGDEVIEGDPVRVTKHGSAGNP